MRPIDGVHPESDEETVYGAEMCDYTRAKQILDDEYDAADGISVRELIDSRRHGGLTYNDFLMLPGYIGKAARF